MFLTMLGATPGPSNTGTGYRSISSSLRVLAQRDIDRAQFVENYRQRYGHTNEADVAFNRLNPPMLYAEQARKMSEIPQAKIDQLRAGASDPRYAEAFDRKYGAGLSRFYLGGQ